MKIYLDMDGTLSDFWGHANALGAEPLGNEAYHAGASTWTPDQMARQERVDTLMSDPDFWLTMPLFGGAHELVSAACSRATTYILTALPSFAKDQSMQSLIREAKRAYAEDILHFPSDRVIICQRKDKARYANTEFDRNLLVDDASQNCDEWRAARGHVIFHRTIPDSIAELKAKIGR